MTLSTTTLESRRRGLVTAAHALIRESGGAGFSMIQLAKRAGVSPATPYNLVGTKADLLRLVVRDEFAAFETRLATRLPGSPLAQLEAAIDLVVKHYCAEPAFYRGLYAAMQGEHAAELRGMMLAEGQQLWCAMVRVAVDAGEIERVVDDEAFTEVLLRAMASTTEAWLAVNWSRKRFAQEMHLATRLLLLGVVTKTARSRIAAEFALSRRTSARKPARTSRTAKS
ncbi:TetR family transcriptional regulator [Rhodopseudomonas palustris]|nr:TetR/AcrR family transcriptional regulator [Rhodopseudomonas palustris]AVT81654.1 TetR family transcriptional regulator [Rhodopseudomonas palustris]